MLKKISYLFCLVILITSCGFKKSVYIPTTPEQEANLSFENQKWLKSKVLYQKLLHNPNLTFEQKKLYLKRLAKSSFETHDFNLSKQTLLQLFTLDPEEKLVWENQKILALSLKELEGIDACKEYLLRLGINPEYPFQLKKETLFLLVDILQKKEDIEDLYSLLGEIYSHLNTQEKQQVEEELYYLLIQKTTQELETLKNKIWNEEKFPQNLISFVYFFHLAENEPANWSFYWSKLNLLLKKSHFVSNLFQSLFKEKENSLGIPEQKIALILPLEGPYASFGWQILKGASLAQWKLLSEGQKVDVIIFNSLSKDWLAKLKESNFKVIGGPIKPENIQKILKSDLYKSKIFFTFASNVSQEGEIIWRFFPSADDQTRILIKQVKENLHIDKFAIFYPDEAYGRKMSNAFYEALERQAAELTGLLSYPPNSPTKWGQQVAKLLNLDLDTEQNQEEKIEFFPEPDFQAVFIPDNLSRAKAIASYFFFYNEPRLFFLGPSIWGEQDSLSSLEKTYLTLSLYPSPWWDNNPSFEVNELKQLLEDSAQGKANFWTALGFDFVRFFASLPLYSHLQAEKINTLLKEKSLDFNWTIAPLHWDEKGQAKQELFLFSLYQGQKKLADFKLLQKIWQKRIENRENKRIKYFQEHDLPLPEKEESPSKEISNEN